LVREEFESDPIGIITNTDIIEAYLSKIDPNDLTAKVLMSDRLFHCSDDCTREKVANQMITNGFYHMLIWNSKKVLIGMISANDIARDIALDSRETIPWIKSFFGIKRKQEKVDKEVKVCDFEKIGKLACKKYEHRMKSKGCCDKSEKCELEKKEKDFQSFEEKKPKLVDENI
jgi:predicted transcriptional regulator